MAVILFYVPFDGRSRDTESLMIAFVKQGHRVMLLNQLAGNKIHDFLRVNSIDTVSFNPRSTNSWVRLIRHVVFLRNFIRRHKIQVVYSHLEPCNFVAAIVQFFVSARVYLCRHHSDQFYLTGQEGSLSYRLTYWLARHIIVVSEQARNFMIVHEGISPDKITVIRLGYDFSLYPEVRIREVKRLREMLACDLTLITVGALNRLKRPDISITVLKILREKNINAKLILLGKGDNREMLIRYASEIGMSDRILLPGYVDNVLEYLSAADILLHPSLSESSCVVVKEAGLAKVPVIVCDGVGDFNTYIEQGKNGWRVEPSRFEEQASSILVTWLEKKNEFREMGSALNCSVRDLFGVKRALEHYDRINAI